MYILKNAWVSIVRNKGRNILITIIIMVIAAACAVTLAIRNSAVKIVNAYEEKYEVEATIGTDRQNLMKSMRASEGEKKSQEEMINAFNEIKSLTIDEINNYGDSQYVKKYYYYYETSVDADGIEEATDSLVKETTKTETTTRTETFGEMPPGGGRPGGNYGNKTTTNKVTTETEKIFNEKAQNGAFQLKGYASLEAMVDFIDGKKTIKDGTIFTEFAEIDNVYSGIISEELATLNELNVGDEITIVNPKDKDLIYKVKITGIYTESSDTANDMTNMFTSSVNEIIVPASLVEKIVEDSEEISVTITPTFILNNKEDVEEFKKEVSEKGLSEYYTVTDNVDVVEGATKSITNVKSFATTFLIITLIIGGVVLIVINMINIRERKYEIGVLRTIGMKKSLVILQFMMELMIVAIVGLGIGAAIGSASSVKVANNLLETEIKNATSEQEQIANNFGDHGRPEDGGTREKVDFQAVNGMVNIEQIDNINAVVDIKVLGELLGIGILLTIISSISAGVAIARFSPLTILKERS